MQKKLITYILLFTTVCSVLMGCGDQTPGDGTQNIEQSGSGNQES